MFSVHCFLGSFSLASVALKILLFFTPFLCFSSQLPHIYARFFTKTANFLNCFTPYTGPKISSLGAFRPFVHIYRSGVEDYAHIGYEKVKEQISNAAKAGNLDCLREAKEWVEGYYDPSYPVGEDSYGEYENRPMMFWNHYRASVENKKK
jgi:hypothetical protein